MIRASNARSVPEGNCETLSTTPSARRVLVTLGLSTAWTGGWQVFAIAYYLKRAQELARLEEIERSLAGE
jgi:hypothetical protein